MSETNFFWDPLSDNILQERDETGAVTAEYTSKPGPYGSLISQNREGVESQYHFDALGSTLALTDDNQEVTDTYAYAAFGEPTEHNGITVNNLTYIGRPQYYRLESELVYLVRWRALSGQLGRWHSLDPSAASDSMNKYLYAYNSPLAFIDHTGLRPGLSVGRLWKKKSACKGGFEFTMHITSPTTPKPRTGKRLLDKLLVVQKLQVTCTMRKCVTFCGKCVPEDYDPDPPISTGKDSVNTLTIYEYLGPNPTSDTHKVPSYASVPNDCGKDGTLGYFRWDVKAEYRLFESLITVGGVEYDLAKERRTYLSYVFASEKLCSAWVRRRGPGEKPRPWWNSFVEAHGIRVSVVENCCTRPPSLEFTRDRVYLDIDPLREGPFF